MVTTFTSAPVAIPLSFVRSADVITLVSPARAVVLEVPNCSREVLPSRAVPAVVPKPGKLLFAVLAATAELAATLASVKKRFPSSDRSPVSRTTVPVCPLTESTAPPPPLETVPAVQVDPFHCSTWLVVGVMAATSDRSSMLAALILASTLALVWKSLLPSVT